MTPAQEQEPTTLTRDAALETAYRLAAGSGIAYNVYHSRRTRSGWQIIDSYRVNKEAFYTVNPDRSATFRLGIDCKARKVDWSWSR